MKRLLLALLVSLWMSSAAGAEDPVHFADPKLEEAVERDLWIQDPTPADMLGLGELTCVGDWDDSDEDRISSLEGLQYALNLHTLNLRFNRVGDVSPLAGLKNLVNLNLSQNHVSDLSPLSGLKGLRDLNLHWNGISDISPLSGLVNVTVLNLRFNDIGDISAVSGMTGLTDLDLGQNQVTDLSPLAGLPHLATLSLWDNGLSDLSPLASVTSLTRLDADINHIGDVSPLAGLPDLRDVDLESNRISDISPFYGMMSLLSLNVRNNPLPQETYDILIPAMLAANPRLVILHSSHVGRWLTLSSTAGGSVVQPGEGQFTYEDGMTVRMEARATPGYVFAGWSGTYTSTQNPAVVTMNQDHEIRADFLSALDTLYVDNSAFGISGPGDPNRDDPNEDGTPEHPFRRIQEAVEVARKGVSIVVRPGIYRENIDSLYKNLHLMGMNPDDPEGGPAVIMEGTGTAPVVHLRGSDSDSSLTGFIITGGTGRPAAALYCDSASPVISHCLIVGNRTTDPNGAVILCRDSRAVLSNCTIADNRGGAQGASLVLLDSNVKVTNSVFWGNSPREIVARGTSQPSIRYCDVQGWWADYGNLHSDPLFARAGFWADPADPTVILNPSDARAVWQAGDYHVKSQAGRWDPLRQVWVPDTANSPCLDSGEASTPVGAEPMPNGGRINMGAYGGTNQASKSVVGP